MVPIDREFALVMDFKGGILDIGKLEELIHPQIDSFGLMNQIVVVNFEKSSLLDCNSKKMRLRQMKDSIGDRLLISIDNYQKALGALFSSDSLPKFYGGQIDEPIFDLQKLMPA